MVINCPRCSSRSDVVFVSMSQMTHPLPPFPGRPLVWTNWTDNSHCNHAVLNGQTLTVGDLAIGHYTVIFRELL